MPEDDGRWFWVTVGYAVLLFLILGCNIKAGLNVNDEVTYLLMADSLSHGTFHIWNGIEEYDSEELRVYSTVRCGGGLCGVPPPLYPILVQPFYAAFGVWGLFIANTLCFAGTIVLVYLTSEALVGGRMFSAFAAVFYSLFTYSMAYGLDLWPHMLSVFLVVASFYLTVRGRFIFTAGLLAGASAGVRYPNLLLAAVLGAYIISRYGRGRFALFTAGAALPVASILLLNNGFFSSLTRTGYTSGPGPIGFPLEGIRPYLFVLSLSAFVVYAVGRGAGYGRRAPAAAAFTVLLLSVVFYAFDDSFPQGLWDSLRIVYAEVVDMQAHPAGDVFPVKKSLLGASPVLALSLVAPWLLRRRLDVRDILLLSAPAVVLILFYSCFYGMHGGKTFFMRYFLESIPFLALMAAYAVKELGLFEHRGWMSRLAVYSAAAVILSPAHLLHPGVNWIWLRAVPISLAVTILAAGALAHRRGRGSNVLFTAILVAMAYGLSANIVDSAHALALRGYTMDLTGGLDFIGNDSAVMIGGQFDVVKVGMLKLRGDVRVVDTFVDNQSDAAGVLSFYHRGGIPVYIYDADVASYRRFIESNLTSYDHYVVEGMDSRVYVIEAQR